MLALIAWIVSGIIIGAIAKSIVPGRDPGELVTTMLLGIGRRINRRVLAEAPGSMAPIRARAGACRSLERSSFSRSTESYPTG